jgi:N-acetylneuraminic acid mutarotase
VPAKRRFEPGPVTLKHARSSFTAFVINDDLVVAGGYGTGTTLLDNAEVYDTKTWMMTSEMPAAPRAGATATALPNLSVILLGGATADSASNAVEIYQPRK